MKYLILLSLAFSSPVEADDLATLCDLRRQSAEVIMEIRQLGVEKSDLSSELRATSDLQKLIQIAWSEPIGETEYARELRVIEYGLRAQIDCHQEFGVVQ